jgi:predicted ester cyclase
MIVGFLTPWQVIIFLNIKKIRWTAKWSPVATTTTRKRTASADRPSSSATSTKSGGCCFHPTKFSAFIKIMADDERSRIDRIDLHVEVIPVCNEKLAGISYLWKLCHLITKSKTMNNSELVRALMSAIEAGNMAKAGSLLTDDFRISGPFPEPLGKDQWLGIQMTMKKAFPDWSFNVEKVEDHGDSATAYYHITGTHKGALDLSPMGMPVIPASSKSIELPDEHADFKIVNGKIAAMEVHSAEGGGLPGLLHQIGVDMPG